MQTKLEQIAIEAREKLIYNNIYNSNSDDKKYSATHTRALSDELTPVNGKGGDVNVGSSEDIYGSPNIINSGRLNNVAINKFNSNETYKKPDTSGNVGQVVI